MRGSIVRRLTKSGPVYFIVYRESNKQKWISAGSRKHDADILLTKVLSSLHTKGYYDPDTRLTFQGVAQNYLSEVLSTLKPSTHISYKLRLEKYAYPVIGHLKLNKITPQLIEKLRQSARRLQHTRANNQMLDTISSVFKYAIRMGLTHENPVSHIIREKHHPTPSAFYSVSQFQLLLSKSDEPWRTMFLTMGMLGLRVGELTGLQKGDIDWEENQIRIQRQVCWHVKKLDQNKSRWYFAIPKSHSSTRRVDMPKLVRESLQIHLITAHENPHELIFSTRNGTPYDRKHLLMKLWEYQESSGLPRIPLHGLRHTYASLMLESGLELKDLKYLQEQLGHGSFKITMDTYAHLMRHRPGPHKLDQLLDTKKPSNNHLTKHSETPSTNKGNFPVNYLSKDTNS